MVEGVFPEYAMVVNFSGRQLTVVTVRETHVAVAAEEEWVVQAVRRNYMTPYR